jgi:hypothetical protein
MDSPVVHVTLEMPLCMERPRSAGPEFGTTLCGKNLNINKLLKVTKSPDVCLCGYISCT